MPDEGGRAEVDLENGDLAAGLEGRRLVAVAGVRREAVVEADLDLDLLVVAVVVAEYGRHRASAVVADTLEYRVDASAVGGVGVHGGSGCGYEQAKGDQGAGKNIHDGP